MIRAFYVGAILVLMFGGMGLESEAIAIEEDADEKVLRVERALRETQPPRFQLQNNPVRPPRCPPFNVDREPLRHGYASQSDRGEWTHTCWYGVRS